jgi:hypothetical protein
MTVPFNPLEHALDRAAVLVGRVSEGLECGRDLEQRVESHMLRLADQPFGEAQHSCRIDRYARGERTSFVKQRFRL